MLSVAQISYIASNVGAAKDD